MKFATCVGHPIRISMSWCHTIFFSVPGTFQPRGGPYFAAVFLPMIARTIQRKLAGYSLSVAENTKQRIWKPRVRAEWERLRSEVATRLLRWEPNRTGAITRGNLQRDRALRERRIEANIDKATAQQLKQIYGHVRQVMESWLTTNRTGFSPSITKLFVASLVPRRRLNVEFSQKQLLLRPQNPSIDWRGFCFLVVLLFHLP